MEEQLPNEGVYCSEPIREVTADFPRPVQLGAVSGAQPKILLVEDNGRFFAPETNQSELKRRFDLCEDLARQLAVKSLESKAGKRSHLSESEILLQYRTRLIATKWTSVEEAHWIIDNVAAKIGWDLNSA